MTDETTRLYEILVCPVCRSSLRWLPDDGEGMNPRAWCRGSGKHLVVSNDALAIVVMEVRP